MCCSVFLRRFAASLIAALVWLLLVPAASAYETYAEWRARHFTAAQAAGPVGADWSDANADGLPNLLHFAFGFSPWETPPPGLSGPGLTEDGARLTFHFPRRRAPGDIRYLPEFTHDLSEWRSGPDAFVPHARTGIDADLELVTLRAQSPLALDGRQFFRLRVERITDSDFDGLDDAWEMAHFGNLSQGYYDDFDRDGIINGEAQEGGRDPVQGNASRDSVPPHWTNGGGLSVTEESAAGFTLSWPEADDDRPGAVRYLVYRNNQPLGSATSALTLPISTTELAGPQRWHVRPVDVAGNVGPASSVVERELGVVEERAFSVRTRGRSGTQGPWGWRGYTVDGVASQRWFTVQTEVLGAAWNHRHEDSETISVGSGSGSHTITRTRLPDGSEEAVHEGSYSQESTDTHFQTYVVTAGLGGDWRFDGAFIGNEYLHEDGEVIYDTPLDEGYDPLGWSASLVSTESLTETVHIETGAIRFNNSSDPDDGATATRTTTLSECVGTGFLDTRQS